MVAVDIKSLRATHWYFQVSGLRIVGQSVKQVKGGGHRLAVTRCKKLEAASFSRKWQP